MAKKNLLCALLKYSPYYTRCLRVGTIICFFMYKNLSPIEIYRRIKNSYGESMISIQYVRKWYQKFKSGCGNIIVEIHSERPISVAEKMLESKVNAIIQCDRKVKLSDIAYK